MTWAPDYAEIDDLAAYVRIADDDDDVQLGLAIATSSRAIDRHCRRQFGLVAAPEVRYYEPRWDRRLCRWVVDVDDLMTTVGLLVNGDVVVDPVLLPRNASTESRPWTSLAVDVSEEAAVTARWGWMAIPDPVKQACLLQSSRIFARRGSPYGIAGSPEAGNELRLLAKVDPDVAVALAPYRKVAMPR